MKIGNDIYYVGVNDHQVDLFEGQYVVPNGMSYNSYVIMDEKIAVMDTVDANFKDEWLENVAKVLDGPCCKHRELHENIPRHNSRCQHKDFYHDGEFLQKHESGRKETGSRKR